jgi:hypothetical protein
MGYDVAPYRALAKQIEAKETIITALLERYRDLCLGSADENSAQTKRQLEEEIKEIEKKQDEYEVRYESMLNFTGVSFVSFAMESHVESVLKMFTMSRLEIMIFRLLAFLRIKQTRLFKGSLINVERVPYLFKY